mmetsp:Transcript_21295/g.46215  ORF Transcript_21295/g.46215 Transcript_21295/m.46215 type:complete len:286 (+) Transcript_21295:199-1056(+)
MLRPLRMHHDDLPALRSNQRRRLRNGTLHIRKVVQRRAKNHRIEPPIPPEVVRVKIAGDELASLPRPAVPRGPVPIHGGPDHLPAQIDPDVHVRFAQSRIDEGSDDGAVSASHVEHFSHRRRHRRPLAFLRAFRALHGDGTSLGNALLQIGLHRIPHDIGLGGLGIRRRIPRDALEHVVQIQIGQSALLHDGLQFLPIVFGYLGLRGGDESIPIRGGHGRDEGVELRDRLVQFGGFSEVRFEVFQRGSYSLLGAFSDVSSVAFGEFLLRAFGVAGIHFFGGGRGR